MAPTALQQTALWKSENVLVPIRSPGAVWLLSGEKIIVQYFLMDVSSGKPMLMDQISAVSVEDLEPVMKRVASNIVEIKSSENNAQVGSIVQEETDRTAPAVNQEKI